jgi:glycosyltransferase involved in cell wall biosynthesis
VTKNVLLVTHRLRGGGAEQVARVWAHAVRAAGHRLDVLVLENEQVREGDLPGGTQVHLTHDEGTVSFLARSRALSRITRERDIDIVLAMQTYPNLVALVAGFSNPRAKVVISEHSVPSIYLAHGSLGNRVQRHLARLLYRRARTAIAVSHAVATDLIVRHGVKQDRCAVIPNGVVDDLQSPIDSVLESRQLTLVVPARLSWLKRPEMAAAIADELRARGHATEVVWIGDAEEDEPDLRDRAADWFRVERWRDDWWNAIPPDAIVLLPSAIEGLGNVLLQSARRGHMSVAGSAALGTGDAIVPGITGYLAATDSVSAFADAVELASSANGAGDLQGWLHCHTLGFTARLLDRALCSG